MVAVDSEAVNTTSSGAMDICYRTRLRNQDCGIRAFMHQPLRAIRSRSFKFAAVLMLIALVTPSPAVEISGAYDAEVAVRTRDEPARQAAFGQGLKTVLVRVTGSRQVGSDPRIAELLRNASNYIGRYQYRRQPTVTPGASPGYLLAMRFDEMALKDVLNELGLPIWGTERPSLLVWLAVQARRDRYLLGETSHTELREPLQTVANTRGVPLMYPLLDLQDERAVSPADVIGGFDAAVRHASGRYQPDGVVIATARQLSDGFWTIRWRLYYADQVTPWDSEGDRLSQAIETGVHRLADRLGERLAVARGIRPAGDVVLTVEGVSALEDYARISIYLATLAQVEGYWPYQIMPGEASFRLRLRGTSRDVQTLIGLGTVLEPVAEGRLTQTHPDPLQGGAQMLPKLLYQLRR